MKEFSKLVIRDCDIKTRSQNQSLLRDSTTNPRGIYKQIGSKSDTTDHDGGCHRFMGKGNSGKPLMGDGGGGGGGGPYVLHRSLMWPRQLGFAHVPRGRPVLADEPIDSMTTDSRGTKQDFAKPR